MIVHTPYLQRSSERVSRIIKKCNAGIAHEPTRTLKTELCHLKDHRPISERAGVVYKVDCSDCEAVYMGRLVGWLSIVCVSINVLLTPLIQLL